MPRMREIGRGQPVFTTEPVRGRLRVLEGPDDVLDLLDEEVTDAIVVVRDAGATFLTPMYHDLVGVICTAGTTRSHIGIVTREFQIPCVMGAELDELPEQLAEVELDCSGDVGFVRA